MKIFLSCLSSLLVLTGAGCTQNSFQQSDLKNKLLCAETGAKYFKSLQESVKDEPGLNYFGSRYSYSPTLNTCLITYTENNLNAKSIDSEIVDLSTNKIIYSLFASTDPEHQKIDEQLCTENPDCTADEFTFTKKVNEMFK